MLLEAYSFVAFPYFFHILCCCFLFTLRCSSINFTSFISRIDSTSSISLRSNGGQSKYEMMDDAEKQLKLILDSMKSLSAREDFIRTLRYKTVHIFYKNLRNIKMFLRSLSIKFEILLFFFFKQGSCVTSVI